MMHIPSPAVQPTAPKLRSFELNAVAHFVQQLPERRQEILAAARRDPQTSGCLVHVYQYLLGA